MATVSSRELMPPESSGPGCAFPTKAPLELTRHMARPTTRDAAVAAGQGPFVHASTAFSGYADEIMRRPRLHLERPGKARALQTWGQSFLDDVAAGSSADPVAAAVVDIGAALGILLTYFEAFLYPCGMDPSHRILRPDDLYEYVPRVRCGDRATDGAHLGAVQ